MTAPTAAPPPTRPGAAASALGEARVQILQGDALTVLRTLTSESVQCVVTSPPYLGLRSYGTAPQVWGGDPRHGHVWGEHVRRLNNRHAIAIQEGLDSARGVGHYANPKDWNIRSDFCACGAWRGDLGLEPTPAMFIEHLVTIFEEVKRVLRPDGLAFVNLGDSYSGSGKGPTGANGIGNQSLRQGFHDDHKKVGIPAKNLLLIPERFAIAMQDAGWIVRSQIVWAKASAMPESVKDRPTSAWESIWMFAKSQRYYFDQESVRQPSTTKPQRRYVEGLIGRGDYAQNGVKPLRDVPIADCPEAGANLRNVWEIPLSDVWKLGPEPSKLQHYAAFPTEIVRRCVLASTSERGCCQACGAPWTRQTKTTYLPSKGGGPHGKIGDARRDPTTRTDLPTVRLSRHDETLGWQPGCSCDAGPPISQVVLDPFGGSGTVGLVASRLGRSAILIELNPAYAEMSRKRIEQDAPMLTADAVTVSPSVIQESLFGEAV